MLKARRPLGRLFHWFVLIAVLGMMPQVQAAGPSTTTVVDVIYRADGTPAQGTLLISWPAFAAKSGEAVAAGTKSVKIGSDGSVRIALSPNTGASPAGTHYKVVLKLDDGTTDTEYWAVPDSGETTVAAIRSKVVPASVAAQFVTRDYVDTALAGVSGGLVVHKSGDESVSGVKTFAVSPVVPAPKAATDVANKSYVDAATASKAYTDSSVAGAKLYTDTAVAGAKSYTDAAVSAKATDSVVLHKSGDEVVGGVKTFALSPMVPSPTSDGQAVNKAYVDTATRNAGSGVALKTNGTLNSSQATLDLKAGANISLVDGGAGAITIQASGGVGGAGAGAGELSLKDFGATSDKKTYPSCSITSGSKTLNCANTIFATSDVGKQVLVMGAGVSGANLTTTITGFTSSHIVTIGTAASTTVSALGLPNYHSGVVVGTSVDDSAAFAAALDACRGNQSDDAIVATTGGCTLKIPVGTYALNTRQVIANWNGVGRTKRVTIECVGGYDATKIIWTGVDGGVAFQVDDSTMMAPPVSILNCGWSGVDSLHTVTPMLAVGGVSHEFSRNRVGPFVKYGVNWSQTWLGKIEFNTFEGAEESVRFDNACNVFYNARVGHDGGCPVNGVTVANNEIALNTSYAFHSLATGQGGSNGNTYRDNDFEGVTETSQGSMVLNDSDSHILSNRFEDNGSTLTTYRSMNLTGGRNQIAFNSFSLATPAAAVVSSHGANMFIANYWSKQAGSDLEIIGQNGTDPDISIGENLARERILKTGGSVDAAVVLSGSPGDTRTLHHTLYDNGKQWFKEPLAVSNPHKVTAQHIYTSPGTSTYSYATSAEVGGKTAPDTPSGAVFGRNSGGPAFVFNQSFDVFNEGPLSPTKVFGWICENKFDDAGCVSTGGGNYSSGTWREVGTIRSNKVRENTAAPTTGTWNVGDFVWNTSPSGTTPTLGWVNTAAGTPGTWVAVTGGSGGGGGTWGSITGTLSSQTDLNTALGLKAPLASPSFTGTVTAPAITVTAASARQQITSTTNGNNAGLRYTANTAGGTAQSAGFYFTPSATAASRVVGISVDDATYQFQVDLNGNVTAAASVVAPTLALATKASYTCDATTRGQFNYIAGAAGVKDVVQVCAKDASNVYAWRTIY